MESPNVKSELKIEPNEHKSTSPALRFKSVALALVDAKRGINQFNIEIDVETGFIDGTALMKVGGKQFIDWYKLPSTKEYSRCLEAELMQKRAMTKHHSSISMIEANLIQKNVEIKLEIENSNGNIPASDQSNSLEIAISDFSTLIKKRHHGQHTFVDRRVAYEMISYISVEFKVQVSFWLDELFITGKVAIGHETSPAKLDELHMQEVKKLKDVIATKDREFAAQLELHTVQIRDLTIEKEQVIKEKAQVIEANATLDNILTDTHLNLVHAAERGVQSEDFAKSVQECMRVYQLYNDLDDRSERRMRADSKYDFDFTIRRVEIAGISNMERRLRNENNYPEAFLIDSENDVPNARAVVKRLKKILRSIPEDDREAVFKGLNFRLTNDFERIDFMDRVREAKQHSAAQLRRRQEKDD